MSNNSTLSSDVLELLKKHNLMDQLPNLIDDLQKELYRNQSITVISATELGSDEKNNSSQNWSRNGVNTK